MNAMQKAQRIWWLARVMMKSDSSIYNSRNKNSRILGMNPGSAGYKFLKIIVGLFLGLTIIFYSAMFGSFIAVSSQGNLISFTQEIVYGVTILMIIMGVYLSGNGMFFGKNLEAYLTLPITNSEFVIAKLVSFFGNMLLLLLIISPAFIVGMIMMGASFAAVILTVFNFLLLMFPLVVVSIILTYLLLLFTPLGKNKDTFLRYSGIIIVILIVVAMIGLYDSIYSPEMMGGTDFTFNLAAVESSNVDITWKTIAFGIISPASLLLPLIAQASVFAMPEALLLTGAALLITALYLGVLMVLVRKIYISTIMRLAENSSSVATVVLNDENMQELLVERGQIASIMDLDRKRLLRNPVLFQQYALSPLVLPILIVIIVYFNVRGIGSDAGFDLSSTSSVLNESLLELGVGLIVTVAYSLGIYTAALGGYSYSAISIEGRDFALSKTFPIELDKYFSAKILMAFLLNAVLPCIIFLIALLVFGISPQIIALGYLGLIPGLITGIALGLVSDILNPFLNWDDPIQLKNRGTIVIILLLLTGVITFISIMVSITMGAIGLSNTVQLILSVSYVAVITLTSIIVLRTIGAKKLETIQL
ncbi:MAG: hypothetical protein Q4E22_02460 [Coriobacteriia bacterium]|nr:hypothetical protein [Coriobacteriia bacterium]